MQFFTTKTSMAWQPEECHGGLHTFTVPNSSLFGLKAYPIKGKPSQLFRPTIVMNLEGDSTTTTLLNQCNL